MRAETGQIILVEEPDFRLGRLQVCPAKRQIIAGRTVEMLQPRIMQVLVALAARRGEVVSHDELMARCWAGFAVSDDAIHRCVARLRRLSEAHGGFRLETVPRVGYQLVEQRERPMITRYRHLFAAAAAAAGVVLFVAGLVYWH